MAESSGSQPLNRRRFPRYACTGGGEVSQYGSRWEWGNVKKISLSGCYIEIVQHLPVGTETQLQLNITGSLLNIAAKVISVDSGIGMGMEFVAVSKEQENKLEEIVKYISAAESATEQQDEHSQPNTTAVQIPHEAAPGILAKIIKQVNEKGVLTRRDLYDIVTNTEH
jgi:hypothetical protein